ncbi:MAG: DUF1700 domain-containing protein [Firmicutes bacterium]|nr:DUF1700 domain-containing protein [Bacillota bacterium]
MKRHEFLDQLWEHLPGVTTAEKVKLIEYYNELYYDRCDRGESEEAIVAGFGTPKEAAEKFISEAVEGASDAPQALICPPPVIVAPPPNTGHAPPKNDPPPPRQQSSRTDPPPTVKAKITQTAAKAKTAVNNNILKNKTFWTVYFSAFVITFPLTIAAFAVMIALTAAAFAVLIAAVAGTAGVLIGMAAGCVAGVYYMATAFVVMADGNIAAGIVQLGISLAAVGVGLIGIFICTKLFKLISTVVRKTFKKEK